MMSTLDDNNHGQAPPERGPFIFLVHGTFAKRAAWPNSDSSIAKAIRESLPGARFPESAFRWDGINTHLARASAGSQLAEEIARTCGDSRTFFAIGHSHGGNVILKAMAHEAVAKKCRGIVFLGTPFLQVTERNLSHLVPAYSPIALALIAIFVVLTAAFSAFLIGGEEVALISGIVTLMIGAPLYWLGFVWFERRLRHSLIRWLNTSGCRLVERASVPVPSCPTFVISTRGDEAGWWVVSADRWAASPWPLLGRIAASFGSMLVGLAVCVAVSAAFGLPENAAASKFATMAVFVAFAGVAIVPVAASLAGGIRALGFGREGVAASLAVRVVPSASPPWLEVAGSERLVTSTAGSLLKGLRHSSFYNDPIVTARIASWVKQRAAEPMPNGPAGEPVVLARRPIPWQWYSLPGMLLVAVFFCTALVEGILR